MEGSDSAQRVWTVLWKYTKVSEPRSDVLEWHFRNVALVALAA